MSASNVMQLVGLAIALLGAGLLLWHRRFRLIARKVTGRVTRVERVHGHSSHQTAYPFTVKFEMPDGSTCTIVPVRSSDEAKYHEVQVAGVA